MPDPVPRAQSQIRTRAALLHAAEVAYREKGFRGATAAEIARRAGVTTGALYGNFHSKDDLLIEVLDTYATADIDRLVSVLARATTAHEAIRAVADWIAPMLTEDVRWRALEVELSLAGLDKPDLDLRLRERQRGFAAGIGQLLEEQSERFKIALPLPAQLLGEAVLALGDGLGVHTLLDPQIDTATVFARATTQLLGLHHR